MESKKNILYMGRMACRNEQVSKLVFMLIIFADSVICCRGSKFNRRHIKYDPKTSIYTVSAAVLKYINAIYADVMCSYVLSETRNKRDDNSELLCENVVKDVWFTHWQHQKTFFSKKRFVDEEGSRIMMDFYKEDCCEALNIIQNLVSGQFIIADKVVESGIHRGCKIRWNNPVIE